MTFTVYLLPFIMRLPLTVFYVAALKIENCKLKIEPTTGGVWWTI